MVETLNLAANSLYNNLAAQQDPTTNILGSVHSGYRKMRADSHHVMQLAMESR